MEIFCEELLTWMAAALYIRTLPVTISSFLDTATACRHERCRELCSFGNLVGALVGVFLPFRTSVVCGNKGISLQVFTSTGRLRHCC